MRDLILSTAAKLRYGLQFASVSHESTPTLSFE